LSKQDLFQKRFRQRLDAASRRLEGSLVSPFREAPRDAPRWRSTAVGAAVGVLATAGVSGLIGLLDPRVDATGLIGLYVFAILPIAIYWRTWVAAATAVLSYLTYNFLFVEPVHTFRIRGGDAAWPFLVALVTAFVVIEIVRRAHLRADEAQWHARAAARARADLALLADEQAALRRVATMVARGVPRDELFRGIAGEVAALLPVGDMALVRDQGNASVVVATSGDGSVDVAGGVATPIVVDGRRWGAIVSAAADPRLDQFAALVATAIGNAEARATVGRLADEQAALRRVATLVAQGIEPAALFAAVTREVARLFKPVEPTLVPSIIRFDPDDEYVLVGAAEDMLDLPLGSRWGERELYVSTRVRRSGRSARVDAEDVLTLGRDEADLLRRQGFLYQVGSPIIVEGRLWGTLTMNSHRALPPDTGRHLESFTELVATAIANSESRAALALLAQEQAALRRVATLVAEGASPGAVFDAVAAEVGGLLEADGVVVARYGADGGETVVARHGAAVEGDGRASGAVTAPLVIEGARWGLVVARWSDGAEPPAGAEHRMAQFAELLETAIANADGREQLMASRARLLTAGDEARRRVVRDLHDGAQQRLVHAIVTLKLAQSALADGQTQDAGELVDAALGHAETGNAELRELAHGILPTVLNNGGLAAGITSVVARLSLPVETDVLAERLPPDLEASAYFIAAEALTNVVKHAQATRAAVRAYVDGDALRVEVRDDGVGGADRGGHGLVGLQDRATALGGHLEVRDAPGGGTLLTAALPLARGGGGSGGGA
jgi:signal transduction histidine kinase